MKLFNKFWHRLKENTGFTLAETLMTVLILLMVSSVVAVGVPAAANAYYKVIDAANAQLLLSETVMKLRSELVVATNVTFEDGSTETVKSYTSGNSGWTKTLSNSTDGIKLKETSDITDKTRDEQLLVPSKMSGAIQRNTKLVTIYGSITYKDGVFTVKNLEVTKGSNTLAEIEQIEIRNLIPEFSN